MKIVQRPSTAAVAIALGLVALVAGASLVMLRDEGWPWHASISESVGFGPTTVEIIDEDGTPYRFAGSSTDAQHWLDRKQHELKEAHGIPAKIAAGRVLQPIGLAFVVAGIALLFWRLRSVRRSRSSAMPAEPPN